MSRLPRLALFCLLVAGPLACTSWRSAPAPDAVLRVGTSGDYAPFSHSRDDAPDALAGYDVELMRSFAADHDLALRWVRFRWPELVADLRQGRFDVALGGVTVRPERSLVGRFGVATAEGGALLLHRDPSRFRSLSDFEAPGVRLAVNAGGHLERVARARFPRAGFVVSANRDVPRALAEDRADAVVTDVFEAPGWSRQLPGSVRLGPFTRDRKAWLVRPDRPALARRIDAWLLARESDGSLAARRAAHFRTGTGTETRTGTGTEDDPTPSPATAQPLAALVAAMDERLALMPAVAEAKRESGRPVRDPERELRVLAAAVTAVQAAAAEAGTPSPHPTSIRTLFAAQIAAARQIQQAVLAGPPASTAGPAPDLASELRPALLRIGERIAALLVRLPAELEPDRAARAVEDGLAPPYLAPAERRRIAEMLAALLAGRPSWPMARPVNRPVTRTAPWPPGVP